MVDEKCKKEMLNNIKSELEKISPLLRDVARSETVKAINKITMSLNSRQDNMLLSDYISSDLNLKQEHSGFIELIPDCMYQYKMQEIVLCFKEIKSQI